ncbi:DarT ssDNA thymidine ADP-ribosyltransferase family protein [Methylomonas sp. BW4-1]|uniref:DarT ssDNA thymidine ADP-ribosyltransferase family protein n=1 Tax=Methylomonas sp. BW4-1 TaxID=3376685 RepID=UPI004041654A
MPIPSSHQYRFIYHFTHIENLPSLLETGFLANNHPKFPKENHLSVAAQGIQYRRAKMEVPCGPGGVVHDYVPLYFGSISPMLLGVINKKNIDQFEMLYFEFPISLICREDIVFTDASANTDQPPNFYSDPADLDRLNWDEINSKKWSSANDTLRHQRMAEVLVHSNLPLQDATRVVVWNEHIKKQVSQLVQKANVTFPSIEFESRDRYHWFKDFAIGDGRNSVVMGPREIFLNYQQACEQTNENKGKVENTPYEKPKQLLESLRENFGCIPQTAELVGLRSENGVHKQTVDMHTVEVVNKLKALPEFTHLPIEFQNRVELAAYLHDIGKGPKSRWATNNGVQKVDPNHPIAAMPMMVEILTQYIGKVKKENANLILKLVCYHDLVGEVLGKDRDEQQIVDVADNELELDMLFALGKADATSLCETWWDDDQAESLYDRCLKAIKLKSGQQ